MKKIIFICSFFLFSSTLIFANPAAELNEKVVKIFKTGFPEVKDASWFTLENYYEVYFKDEDCSTRIHYDFSGNLLSTLCHYDATKLPAFIRAKICSKYSGKSIHGVTELTTQDDHSYQIVLEDEKFWYNVQSDDTGHLSLKNKFKKA